MKPCTLLIMSSIIVIYYKLYNIFENTNISWICIKYVAQNKDVLTFKLELPKWLSGKEFSCQCRRCRLNPQVRKIPWRRKRQPTPVFLPGKSHGQRSLVGCSPWGRKESDTTERLHFHFSLSCIGEGNGKPLQCSCLENPMDGGAW